jgi:hypothetical protein
MRSFFCICVLLASSVVQAYQANCTTDDGRHFDISVGNKVLTVNKKYRHPYQGRTDNGWYEYANSKYIYKTGKFKGDIFPIEVINHRGQSVIGQCSFK